MKRFICIIMLLLCLAMLTACDAVTFLSEVGEQLSTMDDEVSAPDAVVVEDPYVPGDPSASATDVYTETPTDGLTWTDDYAAYDEPAAADITADGSALIDTPADEAAGDPSMPEQPAATDGEEADSGINYAALTAGTCVTDAWPEYPGVIPHITVDCAGADAINDLILSEFGYRAMNSDDTIHYEVFKNNRVLSILMVTETPYDYNTYAPYNLDLATGNAISGLELLQLLGQSAGELAQIETAMLGEEFTHQYGQLREDMGEFYDQQYQRTTDITNAETDRIWLDSVGQLCFVGRIYALAGADYYEYPMSSSLYFQ